MGIVLGTKIATLGKGWERVTSLRQLKDGDIYYLLESKTAGTYYPGQLDDEMLRKGAYRMAPP